jgi:hypothetical protein
MDISEFHGMARFGLGASPQDAAAMKGNARAWLSAQLDNPQTPAAITQLMSEGAAYRAVGEFMESRKQKNGKDKMAANKEIRADIREGYMKECQLRFNAQLQTAQPLMIRSSDSTMHNVHFNPTHNRARNLALTAVGAQVQTTFDHAEFIRIKCDVHPWMFAYISVVGHPYFSVTDSNGVFRIPPGLSAGRYVVTATHLKAGTLTQEVTLKQNERRSVEFQFAVPNGVRPQSQASARE